MVQQFQFWVMPKGSENKDLKRYLYTHIHSDIIIHHSHKV